MGGVRSSARSGAAVLATPASWLLRSPHALRVPEYRLALRVGSVATPRVIMQAVVPWRQGTPCGKIIASVVSFHNLNGYQWASALLPQVLADAEARCLQREATGNAVLGVPTGLAQLDNIL